MENIQKSIGENLRNIRKTRGYSLDAAAEITGVSKAMLGQIERGNPTRLSPRFGKSRAAFKFHFPHLFMRNHQMSNS